MDSKKAMSVSSSHMSCTESRVAKSGEMILHRSPITRIRPHNTGAHQPEKHGRNENSRCSGHGHPPSYGSKFLAFVEMQLSTRGPKISKNPCQLVLTCEVSRSRVAPIVLVYFADCTWLNRLFILGAIKAISNCSCLLDNHDKNQQQLLYHKSFMNLSLSISTQQENMKHHYIWLYKIPSHAGPTSHPIAAAGPSTARPWFQGHPQWWPWGREPLMSPKVKAFVEV